MSAKITKEELKNSIQETENFISMITTNKYTQGDEKNLKDVINRICDVIHAYCTTEVKNFPVIKDFPERGDNFKDCTYYKFFYNKEEQETMINLLKEGKFIPAGSILAGMNFNKTRRKSLSNCYIIPIEEDSIEGIFNCMRNAARTYSYRGGVGIDLTVLRPENAPVNNAADTSSGAVSFMPLISSVNATIGTNGRRAAMMISLDCRHPDLMKFIWSKVDPEAVFTKDYMTMDHTAKRFFDYLKCNKENIPSDLFSELQQFASSGALPTVSTANISVKFSNTFMNRVASNDKHPWTFSFPDIEADKDFYNKNWKGDYEDWKAKGGKIKEYNTYQLTITNNNYNKFIGKKLEDGTVLTEEILLDKLNQYGGNYKATLMNPTPREIFTELAQAAWTRGDPGVLFWDHHLDWSNYPYLHSSLKPFTTNPCFSLDTYVAVADGRGPVTFRTLIKEGKDVPVYTRNLETGKFEIQMGRNPRITRHNAKMVRVHFDNGSYLDVTWDHTFPLQDGCDVKAIDLKPGDICFPMTRSLMSYDEIITKKDVPSKKDHKYWTIKTETPTIRLEHHLVYKFYHPEVNMYQSGFHIHHRDGNQLNNHPDNLERLTAEEHIQHHVQENMIGDNNPARRFPEKNIFRNKEWQQEIRNKYHIGAKRSALTCERISEKAQERWANADWAEKMTEQMSNRSIAWWKANREERLKQWEEMMLTRIDELKKTTDLPLVIEQKGKCRQICVVRKCETCGKEYTVPYFKRDQSVCSIACSNRSKERRLRTSENNIRRYQEKYGKFWEDTKEAQIKIVNDLKFELQRTPKLQEFMERANFLGVTSRIYGMAHGFGTYTNLLKAAEGTNHRVVEVELLPDADVANITVDNTHVVYTMTNFGEGNPENYVLVRQCSEISGYNWAACNLGAHVLPKAIFDDKGDYNPFTWAQNCIIATTLMNFVNDFNETMHPLKEQIEAEQFAKRIGIEFTGLADALSLMNLEYGSEEAIAFVRQLMGIKACAEIYQSTMLAHTYGPAPACDPVKNKEGIDRLLESPYMKNILDVWNKNTWRVKDLVLSYYKKYKLAGWSNDLEARIREYGLRNVALNTVGPTGSLSILADNCSSGIEPVFSLFQKRTTRVGGTKTYTICHTPVARRLLAEGIDEITLDEIKEKYKIKEAHELDYHKRIAMQAAVQEFIDSSISSTVNLPNSCTPEDIVDVYLSAWKKGLKGITVFRDGCMNAVIETVDKKEEKVDKEKPRLDLDKIEKLIKPAVKEHSDKFFTAIAEDRNLPWGHVKEIKSDNNAVRHEVSWNGYKFYIIVTVDEVTGKPMEVFTSNLPYECAIDKEDQFNSTDYNEKISTWMGLTRIISIALRAGVDVKTVIKQLKKSSVYVGSMVAILARVLNKYTMENQVIESALKMVSDSPEKFRVQLDTCPKCQERTLKREGGCVQCVNPECGYSKCE